eukprot:4493129-Alexandrium_andersonii.AAC.1
MSASLVGSEMCIRDRLGPLGAAWRPAGLRSCPCASSAHPPRNGAEACGCLLYTSDAADDM